MTTGIGIKIEKVCPNCGNPKKPGNFGYKLISGRRIVHLPSFLNVCNNCGHEFTFFKELHLEKKEIPVSPLVSNEQCDGICFNEAYLG